MSVDFACEILTPYRRFFTGKVESAIFTTHDGRIEVLAHHESLVAPVKIGQLKLIVGGKVRKAAVTEGFARVKQGRIDLFVDAAEWPEEIDRERAERALGRAMKRLSGETLAWRVESSKRAIARAQNRLAVAGGQADLPDLASSSDLNRLPPE
jgi:F-type H+-transporting ATPase subunit epsilon